MSEKTLDEKLLDLINASGFPFQLALKQLIDGTSREHQWSVVTEEHLWRHPNTGASGYADLVLQHVALIFRCVVECKRVKDNGQWVFLRAPEHSSRADRLSTFWAYRRHTQNTYSGWVDVDFEPASPEVPFCVLFGNDERRPMLERIADELLTATEAIGIEEVNFVAPASADWRTVLFYIPVIITNAVLYIAELKPANMSMETGRLSAEDCTFSPTPVVRFRKGMYTHFPCASTPKISREALRSLNQVRQRSVLVLNSASLIDTLRRFKFPQSANVSLGEFIEQQTRRAEAPPET